MKKKNHASNTKLILFLIVLLAMGGVFTSDLYVSSLPTIKHEFNTSTTAVQLTISIYLISLAISQLIYGPVSDSFGRRKIIIMGLIISFFASIICFFSNTIELFYFGRFIQGMGCGAMLSLTRTISRDLFKGQQLAKFGSYVGIGISVAPAIAPAIGGYIQSYLGWRYNFLLLTLLFFSLTIVCWKFLPETLLDKNKVSFNFKKIIKDYHSLLTNNTLVLFSLISSLCFSTLIVYYTISPFIIISQLKFSPIDFGWFALLITGSNFLGRFLNAFLLKYYIPIILIIFGLSIITISSFTMLFLALIKVDTIYSMIFPTIIISTGTSLVFGNVLANALSPFTVRAGMAGAIYGSIQILGGFFFTYFLSVSRWHDMLGLATILSIISLLALLSLLIIKFQNSSNNKYYAAA